MRLLLAIAMVLALAACGDDGADAAAPDTKVTSCHIEDGLPYAEVRVTNTTNETTSFDVIVQFQNGSTVLGEGEEYTSSLQPGSNQTIRMANMSGEAANVSTCTVMSAKPR